MLNFVDTIVHSLRRIARPCAATAGLAVCALLPVLASAQESYPNKPIHMIVPFAAGGATDIGARLVAERMAKLLGQPVLVENRVGAGGVVGTVSVAKAPPDGYTILFGASSVMLIGPALDPKTPFNTLRDFTVVGQAVKLPLLLVTGADSGIPDLKTLRDMVRANPSKYAYGSAGAGSTSHVAGAALAQMMGAPEVAHAPYKGTSPAIIDLIAGRLTYLVDAVGPVAEHLRSGKLVGLAALQKERVSIFPNIPTIAEAGMPEFADHTWTSWLGIFVPKGTPQAIVDRLNRELNRATRDPEFIKRVEELGVIAAGGTAAEAQAAIEQQAPTWAPLLKRLNITSN